MINNTMFQRTKDGIRFTANMNDNFVKGGFVNGNYGTWEEGTTRVVIDSIPSKPTVLEKKARKKIAEESLVEDAIIVNN